VFNFRLRQEDKTALAKIRRETPTAPAPALRQFRDLLEMNMRQAAKDLPCRVRREHLQRLVDRFRGKYAYVPKYSLERLSDDFSRVIPKWQSMPAQTLIGFDFAGEYEQAGFEYFLSEIALYEDMCFAYNQAAQSRYEPRGSPVNKADRKAHQFYLRTAVLSAFYMVESYLNGIAFDFYIRTKGSRKLSDEEADKLGEWDSKRNREKWMSFRDKIIQYPKIILGVAVPPLTESNCEEVRILTEEVKMLRDSLVHNSPKLDVEVIEGKQHLAMPKIQSIFELNLDKATQVVDSSLRLVKKLNSIVGAHAPNLDWLHERASSGLFPEEAFK
jgi:hypothetical protein